MRALRRVSFPRLNSRRPFEPAARQLKSSFSRRSTLGNQVPIWPPIPSTAEGCSDQRRHHLMLMSWKMGQRISHEMDSAPLPAGMTFPIKFTLDVGQSIHYPMVVDTLGTTFVALSDPTRPAIIKRLSQSPASVHGLTEPFALSQQMISKHIAYLVRARIVKKTKRGRESVCTLRPRSYKGCQRLGSIIVASGKRVSTS